MNHPTCAAGRTLVKSQPPFQGFSVTVPAAYDGTKMYLKISNQHVSVGQVSSGDTFNPDNTPSWTRNQKGNAQGLSHVDYCVPGATPATPDTPVLVLGDSGTVPDTGAVPTTTAPPAVAGDTGTTPTDLPVTGPSRTTLTALMALGFLLTGFAAAAVARRPEDESLI